MTTRVLAALALSTSLLLAASGCFGQDDDNGGGPVSEGRSPQEVLELAKTTLDEAEGVRLDLYADGLPKDADNALVEAAGIVVRPASFDGTGKARVSGFEVAAQLRAIDGDFWFKSDFNDWMKIDPAKYGIPDPNDLLAPDGGLSELLLANEDLTEGESVRGGGNNEEILTSYTGTLPGEAVQEAVSVASGDGYDMEYLVADNGELRQIRIAGEFYDGHAFTYVVNLDDYGATAEITAP